MNTQMPLFIKGRVFEEFKKFLAYNREVTTNK
jgi:hypothetical protein